MTSTDPALELLGIGPVIPVVVLHQVEHAVPLARALLAGGIGTIEVTLRTPAGLPAIEQIAVGVPEIRVGAGTVTRIDQVGAVADAGAGFVVTPGSPADLVGAVTDSGLPLLAGASSLTEMMTLLGSGHRAMKFFPAEQAGGRAFLEAVNGPLPEAMFCPTGGITADTASDYLALPNVACVGGSWLAPVDLVTAGDWAAITDLARRAAVLPR